MNFKAGDKVVVVDDSPAISESYMAGVKPPFNKGEVHCVRSSRLSTRGEPVVCLVGIVMPEHPAYRVEMSFLSSRFRLVSEVKLIMEAVRKNAIGKEVETHTVGKP